MPIPRFAILIHDSPRGTHYDFFLESGDVLKTWALPRLPEPGGQVECDALPDHRPLYLEYEGPISGGRGTVTRWDRGEFHIETWSDENVVIELAGAILSGRIELRRLPGQIERWQLHFSI